MQKFKKEMPRIPKASKADGRTVSFDNYGMFARTIDQSKKPKKLQEKKHMPPIVHFAENEAINIPVRTSTYGPAVEDIVRARKIKSSQIARTKLKSSEMFRARISKSRQHTSPDDQNYADTSE